MSIKSVYRLFALAAVAAAMTGVTSCTEKKFHVEGNIADAKDSTLYLENMSLNGPVAIDSVKLGDDGAFSFGERTAEAPEFYRLRIAGQIVNLAIDSTETVRVKASYPTMTTQYEVEGSDDCSKIKELALKQIDLQNRIAQIVRAPQLGVEAVDDSVAKVVAAYKDDVKVHYIFKAPMRSYAYFALFQTITLGDAQTLIFNPRSSEDDVKVFAAVATSWDTYYPEAERGKNLHNIAIEGMKNVRILRSKMAQRIDPSKVSSTGIIDIALADNHGVTRRLSQLKGKVVMLDFHLFASQESPKRIMMLRDLYNKYHAQGFEIYQVSIDPDEHFWKTQTAALPWVSVRAGEDNQNVVADYNVQQIPTFFLISRDNAVYKRDAQVKDLDAEIRSLL
ncbi:MAG: redoxin domain-containing protein [Prevotella sp.]|nr:redoxin domain-containing protein [Prevotella sp.]